MQPSLWPNKKQGSVWTLDFSRHVQPVRDVGRSNLLDLSQSEASTMTHWPMRGWYIGHPCHGGSHVPSDSELGPILGFLGPGWRDVESRWWEAPCAWPTETWEIGFRHRRAAFKGSVSHSTCKCEDHNISYKPTHNSELFYAGPTLHFWHD